MRTRITLFIVAIISLTLLGWWDHRRLIALEEIRDQLDARVVRLGVPLESERFTKRPRPDRNAEAKLAAAAFIKHYKEREAVKRAGGDPEKSPETAESAPSEWMPLLDSKQVRIVIRGILSDPELDPKSRRLLIGQAIAFFPSNDPTGKLSLFNEFSLHLKDTGLGWEIVRESLAVLAKENPQAALNWSRNHRDDFPSIIKFSQDVLIANTAPNNPALTFEIIREFGPGDSPGHMESKVLRSADPKLRSIALAAFRQHLALMEDKNLRGKVEQQAWRGLAESIASDGFESGSKWLTSVNLTPDELSSFSHSLDLGLVGTRKTDDAGHWIEWAAEILPAESYEEFTLEMVNSWSRNDFRSTGEWINTCPDGTMKYTAIRAYAGSLAGIEPEGATEWAMTLPPGKIRNETLKSIHTNWPKDDLEGAASFAEAHGIK